jgi:phosphatidylglycerophosphate synthase
VAPPPAFADRRPVRARRLPVMRRAAARLARAGITPNAVSLAGLCAGIAAGACLAATSLDSPARRWCWLAAAALVQLRLLANLLDGMVADLARAASPEGEVYNDAPDRASDAATLIGLGYAAHSSPELGLLAALTAVLTAYVRTLGRALGTGQDFRGPMAKPHRMFLVTLTCLFHAASPAAWWTWNLEGLHAPAMILAVISVGCVLTSARRLARTVRTLRSA